MNTALLLMCVFHFFDIEFFCICFFYICHFRFIVFSTGFKDRLNFRHRNYREVFRKQEEAGEEQTKRTKIETNFPDTWAVVRTPARWQEVSVHRSNDNHKTLIPHTDVYNDAHDEGEQYIPPEFS